MNDQIAENPQNAGILEECLRLGTSRLGEETIGVSLYVGIGFRNTEQSHHFQQRVLRARRISFCPAQVQLRLFQNVRGLSEKDEVAENAEQARVFLKRFRLSATSLR